MHAFDQIDVFTDQLSAGNALAVVHDAADLTDDQLAAFARWTNLSETAFLLPAVDPAADYRVRIFTPARELPFAGHPTLGSARAWLHRGGQPADPTTLVQECGAGLIRIRRDGGRLAFAAPPLIRHDHVSQPELAEIIGVLGIAADAVLEARWVDNGPGWLAVRLGDARSVLELEPELSKLGRLKIGVVAAHADDVDLDFEVRAFTSETGREDPVTGSLNAGIAQWLIGTGLAPATYLAAQGTRLGRRGRIYVNQLGADVWIGGDTVVGITGTVSL